MYLIIALLKTSLEILVTLVSRNPKHFSPFELIYLTISHYLHFSASAYFHLQMHFYTQTAISPPPTHIYGYKLNINSLLLHTITVHISIYIKYTSWCDKNDRRKKHRWENGSILTKSKSPSWGTFQLSGKTFLDMGKGSCMFWLQFSWLLFLKSCLSK